MEEEERKVLQRYVVWNVYTRDEENTDKRREAFNQSETRLVCSSCSAPGCGGCGSCAGCGSCTGS